LRVRIRVHENRSSTTCKLDLSIVLVKETLFHSIATAPASRLPFTTYAIGDGSLAIPCIHHLSVPNRQCMSTPLGAIKVRATIGDSVIRF
jgi:hypothetical protein